MPHLTLFGIVLLVSLLPATSSAFEARRPNEIITLQGNGTCGPASNRALDLQVLPNGSLRPFTIPAGEVLVVTGVSWHMVNSSLAPRRVVSVTIGSQFVLGAIRPLFRTGALADATGRSTASVLVPNVVLSAGGLPPCVSTQGNPAGVLVHGFLYPSI
jgi:hypothetical protein